METWFSRRGHKLTDIRDARKRAENIPRPQALTYKTDEPLNRTPFIVTHHPNNPPIREWLRTLHKDILMNSEKMSLVSPLPPILGERNCRNIKTLLMPSILPTVSYDSDAGSHKCAKKCIVCDTHLVETKIFSSKVTGETFTIRKKMPCQSSNIIYLLFCELCKVQYVGQTKTTLQTRFYNHRSDIKKNSGKKKTLVTEHFNLPNHNRTNMRCLPIEQVFSSDNTKLDERENFWMYKLKTLTPFGLNTLE